MTISCPLSLSLACSVERGAKEFTSANKTIDSPEIARQVAFTWRLRRQRKSVASAARLIIRSVP